jgi:hypothetical protein
VAQVTLRFYGRFFYAEAMRGETPANHISAIAPNFDTKRFGQHQCLMTIQRDRVAFGSEGELTTLQPTFRNVSNVPNIVEAETYVWDLAGLRVTYPQRGEVSLKALPRGGGAGTPDPQVLDIGQLEQLAQRGAPSLAESARVPDAHGPANAIVEVTSGLGVAKPVLEQTVQLATDTEIKRAEQAAREAGAGVKAVDVVRTIRVPGTETPVAAIPADLVEFDVPLGKEESLTLEILNGRDELAGVVTVKAGTTIAFSNLCVEIRPPQFQDMEFAQYYTLLAEAPKQDVLIPVDANRTVFSEGQDCDIQTRLQVQVG